MTGLFEGRDDGKYNGVGFVDLSKLSSMCETLFFGTEPLAVLLALYLHAVMCYAVFFYPNHYLIHLCTRILLSSIFSHLENAVTG